jgi:TonB family protein
VDQERLSQSNPEVSHLWDTYRRIYDQSFGEGFSFNKLTQEQEKQMTELGTKLLPDLKSGKYQRAYEGSKCGEGHRCDNYLAWRLQGYTEAQPYDPATVTLLDATALHLIRYVPPVVPRLAMLARIYGDVRMRIQVEPETGLVRNVEALSGHPLLSEASIAAARSWQFAPESLTDPLVEATLHFQLQCR